MINVFKHKNTTAKKTDSVSLTLVEFLEYNWGKNINLVNYKISIFGDIFLSCTIPDFLEKEEEESDS